MRILTICLAVLGLAALPAWAQDAGSKAPQAGAEPPQKARDEAEPAPQQHTAPISGVQMKINLKSGGVFKGVRRGPLYVKLQSGRYVEADPKDKGAGVRLFFPRGQNGSVMIPMLLVDGVEELGALTDVEGKLLARSIDDLAERAHAERIAAKAAAETAAIEAEKARLVDEATTVVTSAEDLARASELAEFAALLSRFPPGTWTLETPDQIARRRVVMSIQPSEEDIAFLRSFETWKKAYGVWQVGQAAALAAKAAEEAKSETDSKTDADETSGKSGSQASAQPKTK